MLIERVVAFVVVLIFFLPVMSKVVRLASRTWDEREFLDTNRVRQIVFVTPVIVLVIFFLFYFGVIVLLEMLII